MDPKEPVRQRRPVWFLLFHALHYTRWLEKSKEHLWKPLCGFGDEVLNLTALNTDEQIPLFPVVEPCRSVDARLMPFDLVNVSSEEELGRVCPCTDMLPDDGVL